VQPPRRPGASATPPQSSSSAAGRRGGARSGRGAASASAAHPADDGGDGGGGALTPMIRTAGRTHSSPMEVDGCPRGARVQWFRVMGDQAPVLIDGATGMSYQPTVDDVACVIRAEVTTDDGRRAEAASEAVQIDPKVREKVQRSLTTKNCTFNVRSASGGALRSLLLESSQLKVKEGKKTRLKHAYHHGFKVALLPQSASNFRIDFNEKVSMEFEAANGEERDVIALAIRSFCLLYIKKKGRR
jgi:hypothetical protein